MIRWSFHFGTYSFCEHYKIAELRNSLGVVNSAAEQVSQTKLGLGDLPT